MQNLATEESTSLIAFLQRELGTRKWVVADRMSPYLKEHGYEVAVSAKRYGELLEAYEIERYGAPLKALRDAAPEMFAQLRGLVFWLEGNVSQSSDVYDMLIDARAIIAKAEGRTE